MMWLEQIDQQLLLLINGAHNPFLDEFFWIVSGKLTWIPFYLFVLYMSYSQYGWKKTLLFFGGIVLCIIIGDVVAAKVIKESIARYRPSHHTELSESLRFYLQENGSYYRGGMYGFVSNHATNFAVLATWIFLHFQKTLPWLAYLGIAVAILVGYSRMYLGVHYPSDILGGYIFGSSISLIAYFSIRKKLER